MKKAKQTRILVVDDHRVVRIGLRTILDLEPELLAVAEAEDGAQAVALFREHQPDITLMDLRMPGLSGVETTIAIRKEFPAARIIMLTTYDGDEDIYRALKAGARGYLLKNVLDEELINAIQAVHAGGEYLPAAVARRLSERSPDSELTTRELEVLPLLAKGLSNREIAEMLGFTEFTAKAHVAHILEKLSAADRAEATAAAFQRGILHLD